MRYGTLLISGLAAALLAGCANPRAEQALAAREALVGLERTELLACAGVPNRSRVEGDTEFFTYGSGLVEGRGQMFYGGGVFSGGFGRPSGHFVLTPGADFSSRYCEATFVLEDGVVRQVNYVAASGIGGARYEQCYFIIASCLDRVAARGATGGVGGADDAAPANEETG
jgi:hypothetical protein